MAVVVIAVRYSFPEEPGKARLIIPGDLSLPRGPEEECGSCHRPARVSLLSDELRRKHQLQPHRVSRRDEGIGLLPPEDNAGAFPDPISRDLPVNGS